MRREMRVFSRDLDLRRLRCVWKTWCRRSRTQMCPPRRVSYRAFVVHAYMGVVLRVA